MGGQNWVLMYLSSIDDFTWSSNKYEALSLIPPEYARENMLPLKIYFCIHPKNPNNTHMQMSEVYF
jgi:hypothetical protein